jgi:hypothetical protein
MKGTEMTTTIEHQAALARIDEMRRYADATRRHRRADRRPRSRHLRRSALATARRRLRLA